MVNKYAEGWYAGLRGHSCFLAHNPEASGKSYNDYWPVLWLGWLEIPLGKTFGPPRLVWEPPKLQVSPLG